VKFIFISPIRVPPQGWSKFSSQIARLFRDREISKHLSEWRVEHGDKGRYNEIITAAPVTSDDFSKALANVMCKIRRNGFAIKSIDTNSCVVLFDSADIAVIEMHEVEDDCEESHLEILDEMRANTKYNVDRAVTKLDSLLNLCGLHIDRNETTSHTILSSLTNNTKFTSVVKSCFLSEGLEQNMHETPNGSTFSAGWSFTTLVGEDIQLVWVISLMTRLQCEWYTTRINRDYCLRIFGDTNLDQTVFNLINDENQIVNHQTELRLWQHRMREFRANLKPELSELARLVEVKWQVLEEQNYIHETMSHARNFIQTSYTGRLLIQERRQSALLFLLTAIGVLSIASAATEIWSWLTLANITNDTQVATASGKKAVLIGISSLGVSFIALCMAFFIIRNKRR